MLSLNEQRVLEACRHATRDRPITRDALKDITKCTDRDNREVIGRLRDKGYRIINSEKGYWYGDSKEYASWIKKYTSYAMTILRRKSAMDNMTEGQMEL